MMDHYLSTYQLDYLWPITDSGLRETPRVDQGQVECRDIVETKRHPRKSAARCPCSPGSSMPQRAEKRKLVDFDVKCGCPPPNEKLTREEMAKIMYEAAEAGAFKIDAEKNANCTSCFNKADLNPLKGKPTRPPEPESYGQIRPMAPGAFGGAYEGPMNLPNPSDQATPYVFSSPCKCQPSMPLGGPQDYGPAWIRENARDKPVPEVRKDENKMPETSPLAVVKCAGELDALGNGQPNTFMKKLYQKYPYLYQILKDTPPEELMARVFKDRFLSTYQVDYLHMGSGKEHYPAGGSLMNEKYTGPDGSPEPDMIPGCFYRFNKKEFFGKKKNDLKSVKEKKAEEEEIEEKPEPDRSEYMRSISKLGGDIISDQLYKIEAATKRMMKTYINF